GGGGGGSTDLPDLATTVHGSVASKLKLGQPLTTTVTVTNKGKAAAGGVHALISLSANAIPKLPAHASRGPGCTGVTVLDCDLGSLQSGASTTVTFGVTAQTGKNLFIGAQAQEIENDATLTDNSGSLTLSLVKRLVPLKIKAIAARITAHQQLVYLSLSRAARVTAQNYIAGHPRPIDWRRSLGAGTIIVRIPIPTLAKGQHFSIVLRAKSGTASASTKLKLVAH
ncbi:MAG TPA: CARDB domain-containing protein, partial [Gaiellaceae bacterium]|nr:CARDB domain-containing protein [Gaiellaceae bacterium]